MEVRIDSKKIVYNGNCNVLVTDRQNCVAVTRVRDAVRISDGDRQIMVDLAQLKRALRALDEED